MSARREKPIDLLMDALHRHANAVDPLAFSQGIRSQLVHDSDKERDIASRENDKLHAVDEARRVFRKLALKLLREAARPKGKR